MEQLQLPIREQVLFHSGEIRKNWVGLGACLNDVIKGRLYEDWGFRSFEVYIIKELGLTKPNAVALMKNYKFLEQDKPHLTQLTTDGNEIPEQDSVKAFRSICNKVGKQISSEHFDHIESIVFDDLAPAKEVKMIIKECKEEFENKSSTGKIIEKRRKQLNDYLNTLSVIREEYKNGKLKFFLIEKQCDLAIVLGNSVDKIQESIINELDKLVGK